MKPLIFLILLYFSAAAQDSLYLTKIVAPDRRTQASFGEVMAYTNGHLFIGSPTDDRKGFTAGAVYLYEINNLTYHFKLKHYTWNIKKNDYLGHSISVFEDNLYLRVFEKPILNPIAQTPGVLHYYKFNNYNLYYQYRITSPHPVVGQNFGTSVKKFRDQILVSASGSVDSSYSVTGAFYVYSNEIDSLQMPVRYLGKPKGEILTSLGNNFISNDELLIVSAKYESDSISYLRGCIYVYKIEPDTLILKEKICSPLVQSYQLFGGAMALSGNRLYIGAPQEDAGFDQGSVYVYDISGDSLRFLHLMRSPGSQNVNNYGMHLIARGDTLLVSAPRDSSFGWLRGAIYLYQFDENNQYRLIRTISMPDTIDVIAWPSSVVMTDDFILTGAEYDDEGRGAVYMFTKEKPVAVKEEPGTPFRYRLGDNYPNPFNPVTRIPYEAGESARLRIVVYDVLGRELAVLTDEYHPQGSYEAVFDATGLSSGIYFYSLETETKRITKKLVLLR